MFLTPIVDMDYEHHRVGTPISDKTLFTIEAINGDDALNTSPFAVFVPDTRFALYVTATDDDGRDLRSNGQMEVSIKSLDVHSRTVLLVVRVNSMETVFPSSQGLVLGKVHELDEEEPGLARLTLHRIKVEPGSEKWVTE